MSVTSRNSRLMYPPACPACGDALPATAQFCPGCGRPIVPLQRLSKSKNESDIGPRTDQPLVSAVPAVVTETKTDLADVARFLPQRYQPLKKLGQGGMGTVYLCMDQALERQVAIKIMTERYQADPQGEKRFMREARAQAIVNHPNMATVLNFGVSQQGRLFLVMEYLEGEDIRAILRRDKAVQPLVACEYLAQACEGLGEAHNAGLIHRDLKPSNIMIVKDHRGSPRVKILDLGLAKIIGGQTDLKSITVDTAGMLIGTPAYMSPEQVAGASVDGRADVYSMGVVFFEMITGRLPFESETMEGWLYQHLHVKPPAPSQVNPELARYPQLDQITLWMMSKQPQDRPKSAGEMAVIARRLVEHKLMEDRPARKSGPRPALPFEDNPPARKSGPRVSIEDAPPPPPDVGGKRNAVLSPPPAASARSHAIELQQRREADFQSVCKKAEEAEAEGHWEMALDVWRRAMTLAEDPGPIRARIESCRKELEFQNQLASAGSAASAGDWERAEEILSRLTSLRPSDLRIEQARARLPRRLVAAWSAMARTRIEALPEGDLRSSLLQRLGTAYAQAGDLQNALTTLQDASRKTDARVINLAHAISAAIANGHHEGLRPFLDRAIAAANGLIDPSDRGRANLEVGRAMTAYGDHAAAASAFQSALAAFSDANTKGIPVQVPPPPRRGSTGSLRRSLADMTRNLSGTISTTGMSAQKSMRAAWETAVGIVAQAQAEAGLVEDCLASAALIEDPWNLAQTLSQVAQALAKTGRTIEAERVAGQITFALPKAQAYRGIAVSRVYRGDLEGAEELFKNLTIPGDRVPVQGLLAAAWTLRNQKGKAEVRIAEAVKTVQEIVGARARFKAVLEACEPLLDAGFTDLAKPLLDDASRLVDLIDDPAERLRSMLQMGQMTENARSAHAAATRTVVFSYQPSQALIELLRRALVVWRQVRPGTDRQDCIERLAYSIGSAAAPALASEMLSACRDEPERALVYIGLISGLA